MQNPTVEKEFYLQILRNKISRLDELSAKKLAVELYTQFLIEEGFITGKRRWEVPNQNQSLTLEDQLSLQLFRQEISALSEAETKEKIIELYVELQCTGNKFKKIIKEKWRI